MTRFQTLRRLVACCALAALILAPGASRADDKFTAAQRAEIVRIVRDALIKDPSILRDAVGALQEAEQQQQAQAQKAALGANRRQLVDPADPVAGNPNGDVTIVEFFDVRCPYCKRMEAPMTELMKRDPNIRLVYKDMPVLGPASTLGARALLAAERQGGYEKLRDVVMAYSAPPTVDGLRADATKLGLDWERMRQDMSSPEIEAQIQKNLKLATTLGIQGTPAFVIGDALIPGAVDAGELRDAVAAARHK